jgi:restriction system protein
MLEFLAPAVSIFILFLLGFLFFKRVSISGEARVARRIESLRRKNKEYHLFNNIILKTPDGTTQIDHILISPYGIFVFETKNFSGWIFGDAHGKKWTQSLFSPYQSSSIKFQFQNPIHQNYKHVKAVEGFLGIDSKSIFNVVVFAGGSAFKTDMPENVLELHELLPYIKLQTKIFFTNEKVEAFSQKLRDYIDHTPDKEEDHLKNLANNRLHPTCPKCGKLMVLRRGPGGGSEFWGCPNFPGCRVTKKTI